MSLFIGYRGTFSRVNLPGRAADHSLPSRAQVMNEWNYTSTSPYAFMTRTGKKLLFILYLSLFLKVLLLPREL